MIEIDEQIIQERIRSLEKESDQYQRQAMIQVNAKIGEFAGRIQALRWMLNQNQPEQEQDADVDSRRVD